MAQGSCSCRSWSAVAGGPFMRSVGWLSLRRYICVHSIIGKVGISLPQRHTLYVRFVHTEFGMRQTSRAVKAGSCVAVHHWPRHSMPCTCRCYDRPTLDRFARHYQTGELLPDDLFQKLVAARTFRHAHLCFSFLL